LICRCSGTWSSPVAVAWKYSRTCWQGEVCSVTCMAVSASTEGLVFALRRTNREQMVVTQKRVAGIRECGRRGCAGGK